MKKVISKNLPVLVVLILVCLLGIAGWLTQSIAQAAPMIQIPIYTPTPGPDGRIIYIVKAGDTLISISIISGVPVDQLRELNKLPDDNIQEGQQLVLGLAGPGESTVTPGPTPTPTAVLPTPSPKPGTANLCVLLFNDANGDSVRQEEEAAIPDGVINVSNSSGTVNLTANMPAGLEAHCFEEIAEGEYSVGVAVPLGYNATTELDYIVVLKGGDNTILDFGAQERLESAAEDVPTPTGENKSPLLAIFGGVFVLLGVLLAVFARQILKGK